MIYQSSSQDLCIKPQWKFLLLRAVLLMPDIVTWHYIWFLSRSTISRGLRNYRHHAFNASSGFCKAPSASERERLVSANDFDQPKKDLRLRFGRAKTGRPMLDYTKMIKALLQPARKSILFHTCKTQTFFFIFFKFCFTTSKLQASGLENVVFHVRLRLHYHDRSWIYRPMVSVNDNDIILFFCGNHLPFFPNWRHSEKFTLHPCTLRRAVF